MHRAPTPTRRAAALAPLAARARRVAARAMSAPAFEIAVKGLPKEGILADCEPEGWRAGPGAGEANSDGPPPPPARFAHRLRTTPPPPAGPFSHRALLVLEEKKVPYTRTLIDLEDRPDWIKAANPPNGAVPVLKDLETGTWLPDSGAISDMLEERFPEPPLGKVDALPAPGAGIFGAFKDYCKAETAGEAATREGELRGALGELEAALRASGGPFVGGGRPNAHDCSLAPKLYHAVIALDHFKGWSLPGEFSAVRAYLDAWQGRESWRNTAYSPELVIKGWEKHGLVVRK
jgi:glutathione S-transferase